MNEPSTTTSADLKPTAAEFATLWSQRLAGPAVTVFSYGLIIGLALTGLGVMAVSAITWLFSGADWFCGIGLLTGGIFLASASVLFLGQLTRTGEAISRNGKTPDPA
ncbi:hypothetical protein JO972_09130 [Verrucomicrobiaceae bacterium 5K15]|uniref:Uncharacterized protein n=1 Tax=Oceaniferula flava TaxID=2800421 RepID=A0AAE2VC26_9BACT|nr:hypothetical protein [Oceaniferula flavus]MBK1855120.1 hypothetical protein [Oceaniferula flavus]MBM1136426.1 hypothetical protein [Oceaniferula flavus]